eukprot:TRINITY_DN11307_c0_g1_i2.p1 TRINITY_DN11307_c0_g1~~TRINITY_DN11307_c0_g1_i2.p1  ORF type:complete len:179 (-),score=20.77 TRINITY_DN11307_c0_g1_i2:132-668(-)
MFGSLVILSVLFFLAVTTVAQCPVSPGTIFNSKFGRQKPAIIDGTVQWVFGGGSGVTQWQPYDCANGILFFLKQTWSTDGSSFAVIDVQGSGFCSSSYGAGVTVPCPPNQTGQYSVRWNSDCTGGQYVTLMDACEGRRLKWSGTTFSVRYTEANMGSRGFFTNLSVAFTLFCIVFSFI